jgi:hypothetical protein
VKTEDGRGKTEEKNIGIISGTDPGEEPKKRPSL